MKKEELIRYRAGLAALLVSGSMFLSGCVSSECFEFKRGEDNSYVAYDDSYINNVCIGNSRILEVHNKLTDESKIYIVRKANETFYVDGSSTFDYVDLLTNVLLFNSEGNVNFEIIEETSLYDYMVSLDLVQERYSHEDMIRILEEIKAVYEFENDKELVK